MCSPNQYQGSRITRSLFDRKFSRRSDSVPSDALERYPDFRYRRDDREAMKAKRFPTPQDYGLLEAEQTRECPAAQEPAMQPAHHQAERVHTDSYITRTGTTRYHSTPLKRHYSQPALQPTSKSPDQTCINGCYLLFENVEIGRRLTLPGFFGQGQSVGTIR
jgi:hypothetical protein